MKNLNIILSILGVGLLCFLTMVGLEIYTNYRAKVHSRAPIIKHDPSSVFEFEKGDAKLDEYIGNLKGINIHEDDDRYVDFSFDEFLEKHTKTSAFVVIRKDSIIYERYFDDYTEDSMLPSFSLSKAFISALVGIAIEEGKISSVHDPVTNYIEELKDKGEYWGELTIEHLLNMQSGLEFIEIEKITFPYFGLAHLYLSNNVMRTIQRTKFRMQPGSKKSYQYSSLDNQILGIILQRATGQNLADLMEEKIWKKIGMQEDATWSYDSHKHKNIRSYCCMKATALDYARFGRLYLNKGNWNGKEIIPNSWVKETTTISPEVHNYKYQWFPSYGKRYAAMGLYGQLLYINPETETIFIRLGKKDDFYIRAACRGIERKLRFYELSKKEGA